MLTDRTPTIGLLAAATVALTGCQPSEWMWAALLFIGVATLGVFFLLGWIFQKLRDLGDEIAALLDEWRRSGMQPPVVDPMGFAITGQRLSIEKGTVRVQEDDFASWSFSMSNPARLEITIRSELYSDGAVVRSQDEVTTAASRGFAISRTLAWAWPGQKEVKGRTTFSHGGQVIAQAEQIMMVTVRGDE